MKGASDQAVVYGLRLKGELYNAYYPGRITELRKAAGLEEGHE